MTNFPYNPNGGWVWFQDAEDAALAGIALQYRGFDVDLYPYTVLGYRQGYMVRYTPAALGLN